MIDVNHKRCITCRLKQPSPNYPNETQRLYCNDGKKCGMVNIMDRRCITCNLKIPNFNDPNEKNIIL